MKKKDENGYHIVVIDPTRERIEVRVNSAIHSRNVGVKVPNDVKKTLMIGQIARIEHQGILSGGGLRHPVFKGVV